MKKLFVISLLVLPVAEIIVFFTVGGFFGLLPVVGLIFITAIIGITIIRFQGLSTLYRAEEALLQNKFPLEDVFNRLCVIMAGAFLLIPGFITDAAGLLLLVPFVRVILNYYLRKHIANPIHFKMGVGQKKTDYGSNPSAVIDGEYTDITNSAETHTPERK